MTFVDFCKALPKVEQTNQSPTYASNKVRNYLDNELNLDDTECVEAFYIDYSKKPQMKVVIQDLDNNIYWDYLPDLGNEDSKMLEDLYNIIND